MSKVALMTLVLAATSATAACNPAGLWDGATSAAGQVSASTTPTVTQPEATPTPDRDGGGQEGPGKTVTQQRSFAGTTPAPEFPPGLDWLNTDRPLSLAQLKGKVVVLDFWTYGCINCMHIIPDLKRLEAEYADELVVIGVHSAKFENEGDTENIRQIILRYGLEHPVVNDRDFSVWRMWGAQAWPTVVLIDPAGNVVGGHSGEGVYPLFQPVIQSLVQEFDARGLLDRTPLSFKLEREGLPETVLSFPGKVLADAAQQRLFIADTDHNRIVVADMQSGEVLNVVGAGEFGLRDGDFRSAAFAHPQGMALSEDGQTLYVADTENHALRRVDLKLETVATLVGTGSQSSEYPLRGGQAPNVALNSPWDLALDGQQLYIAMAGTHQVWVMDLSSGMLGPFAGNAREGTQDGPLAEAELAQPSGLSLDGKGRLYFTDPEASTVRWATTDPLNGQVSTLVGSGASLFDFGDVDGVGHEARLQHALGVVYYQGALYVVDTYNSKIKRVDPQTQEIRTMLGGEHGWRDGKDPLFYEPGGIDAADGRLYVADTNNHAVRVIDLATQETNTLVLKDIERFMPAADDVNFGGNVVRLNPVALAPGEGKLVLDVQLPEGYKVNQLAPSSIEWQVEDGIVELPPDADLHAAAPHFPLEWDVTFDAGAGDLTGDLTIFYCEAEKQSVCLIEQVRLEAPLEVGPGDNQVLKLQYRIELPDLGN